MGLLDVFKSKKNKNDDVYPQQQDPEAIDESEKSEDLEVLMAAAEKRDQLMTPRGMQQTPETQEKTPSGGIGNPFRDG